MSDETVKVTISTIGAILIAWIGVRFGRQPKPDAKDVKAESDTQRMTGLDPALMTFIERLVDERVADITRHRDDLLKENTQLKDRIRELETRVDVLEDELAAMQRPSNARTRAGDVEAEG